MTEDVNPDNASFGPYMNPNPTLEDITPNDDDTYDSIARKIHNSLNEPNYELIERIVFRLGVDKALDLYKQTKDIEEKGGIFVQNGNRRKTSGGVFFYLAQNDRTVPKTVLKDIFRYVTCERERMKKESVKERRRKQNELLKQKLIAEGLLDPRTRRQTN